MFRFEELTIYQDAIKFSSYSFNLTKSWSSQYRYSLADQLHRAALSISLNIAEGSGRTSKDFMHFLSTARGSCYECVAVLTIAKNEKFISEQVYHEGYFKLESLSKMISSLRSKLSVTK